MAAGLVCSRILRSSPSDQRSIEIEPDPIAKISHLKAEDSFQRRLVKALQIQHDRPERHDHHEKPLIAPEWIEHVCEMRPGCGVKPQDVSNPQ